jgi:hypothetical protein
MRVILERNGRPANDHAEVFAKSGAIGVGRTVSSARLPRDGAMSERIFWLPAIAVLGLFGTGCVAPALARASVHGPSPARSLPALSIRVPSRTIRGEVVTRGSIVTRGGVATPRIVARHIEVQNELRSRHHVQLENGWPIAIWPFFSSIDTTPTEAPLVGSEVSSNTPVIVISGSPNGAPDRAVSEKSLDYSYVAGCRAIPNGYHCDAPHNEAAAP